MVVPFGFGKLHICVCVCVHFKYILASYCFCFSNLGFAVTQYEADQARYSFFLYRAVFVSAIGISALFSLVIPVKVYLISLSVMFLMFAPLHLMATHCSDPRPYVFNEVPIYFIDE